MTCVQQSYRQPSPTTRSCTTDYMNILTDECNGWHSILPPTTPLSSSVVMDIVSLDSLIRPELLKKKARLELGVLLAHAVLQLHETGWLRPDWGKWTFTFYSNLYRFLLVVGILAQAYS
jgi:hypothetical protein